MMSYQQITGNEHISKDEIIEIVQIAKKTRRIADNAESLNRSEKIELYWLLFQNEMSVINLKKMKGVK